MADRPLRPGRDRALTARLIAAAAVASAICGTVAYELTIGIVSVALPHMQGTFSATPDQIAWVLTSFTVGTIVMIGCSGWFSSRFGRKRFFLFSLVGFALSSALCGAADSLAAEAFWRLMQGLLGAPLMPLGQAITLDAFPEDKKELASSLWATGAVGGIVIAPVIGGYLVEHYDWRWIFYITLPVSLVALIGTWAFVDETERHSERGLDWVAFVTLIIAIAALQLGLSRGEREDWFESTEIVTEFSIAAVAVLVFIVRNAVARYPFIPRELLADKNFVIGAVLFFVFGAVLFLPVVLLPLLLQQLSGYPVLTAGALLLPRGSGTILALLLTGSLLQRTDPRKLLILGFVLIAIANWQMARWTAEVSMWQITWTTMMQGFGSGITFVPNIAIAFMSVSTRYRTEGFSFLYLLFYFGSAIGVAIIFALHANIAQVNRSRLVENVTEFNERFRLPGVPSTWDPDTPAGLAALSAEIDQQAQMIAYSNTFLLIALTAAAMLPLILIVRKPAARAMPD